MLLAVIFYHDLNSLEMWSFELMVLLSGLYPNPELETSVLSIRLVLNFNDICTMDILNLFDDCEFLLTLLHYSILTHPTYYVYTSSFLCLTVSIQLQQFG